MTVLEGANLVALIVCPECQRQISDRASSCPHCGLPARHFHVPASRETKEPDTAEPLDLGSLRNALISFDHSYRSLFGANHYITARELASLRSEFNEWAESLSDKESYDYCREHAHQYAVDMDMLNACLRHFETLEQDAESHNAFYVDRVVEQEKEYFDELLADIDPNIRLDEEQRRAVVTDDDHCLLVAGAGAGKTTTMAAKVKYLVEKKGVRPEEIIVISYTRKAIDELKQRINVGLGLPAKICTFHSFAYDIVRKFNETPPEVNYSAYNIRSSPFFSVKTPPMTGM
jgi:DNA helicase-4